jgi:beta-mannosidase
VASIPVGPAELVADADGLRAVSHTEVKLDPAPFTAVAEQIDGGWSVTVTASALARDVSVLADALAPDATVDQMLITLLPGETTIFRVRTQHPIAPEDLTGPAVLRSANALFAPAATR